MNRLRSNPLLYSFFLCVNGEHVQMHAKSFLASLTVVGLMSFAAGSPALGAAAIISGNDRNDIYWSYNYDSVGEARQTALRNCRKQWGDCQVEHTFSGACFAIARPTNRRGHGWAVRPSQRTADAISLDECEKTNKKECRVEDRFCDEK